MKTKTPVMRILFAASALAATLTTSALQKDSDGYYLIGTALDLAEFSNMNSSDECYHSGRLTADIVWDDDIPWVSIGFDEDGYRYSGTFDGQGHRISGLKIVHKYNNHHDAMFGAIATAGVVKNFSLENCHFESSDYVAGVCGSNLGRIENVSVSSTDIIADGNNAGGIAAWSSGTIISCNFSGTVTCEHNNAGGIAGGNSGLIQSCVNRGSIYATYSYSAGIAGENRGTIADCMNEGNIGFQPDWINEFYLNYVGGIVGKNYAIPDSQGLITRCNNVGNVKGINYVGGICALNESTITLSYDCGQLTPYSWADLSMKYCGGLTGMNSGTVSYCYTLGKINLSPSQHSAHAVGGFCGEVTSTGTHTCCYIQAGSYPDIVSIGGSDGITRLSPNAFASGKAACLMNNDSPGSWYQDLSDNGESSPTLSQSSGTVYSGYDGCHFTYSNSPLSPSPTAQHNFDDDGFCTVCQGPQPAILNNGTYEISKPGHLYWFADQVNNGNVSINGALTRDIVVNTNVLTSNKLLSDNYADFRKWIPIGFDQDGIRYKGTFDGQGHTVSGLYWAENEYYGPIGFFGATAPEGTVCNLGLLDSYFYSPNYPSTLCGLNNGHIANCYSFGTANGQWGYTGGLIGLSYGKIESVYFAGRTLSDAGETSAICTNTGGENIYYFALNGSADGIVARYRTDEMVKNESQFASGEVAWLLNGSAADASSPWRQTIGSDPYPTLDSTHNLVYYGGDADPNYTNCTHTYDDDGFCTICGYAHFAEYHDGYYELANPGNLVWFANTFNSHSYADDYMGAKLVRDIDLTPLPDFQLGTKAIPFYGIFDGQGHTISSVNVTTLNNNDAESYGYASGLFGIVNGTKKDGTAIKNLTVQGTLTTDASTDFCLGGVVAIAYGNVTIEGVVSQVSISQTSEQSGHIGGIVGTTQYFGNVNNSGTLTIDRCISGANINTTNTDATGGVIGYVATSDIKNCLFSGVISAQRSSNFACGIIGYSNNSDTKVNNCLSVGSVTVNNTGKGFAIGYFNSNCKSSNVNNNYWKQDVADAGVGGHWDDSQHSSMAQSASASSIASGEVAYNLNLRTINGTQAWYQNLGGSNADPTPVPDNSHGAVYACCAETITDYSNTPSHHFDEQGFCIYCDAPQNATLNGDYYEISKAAHLYWFAERVNIGAYGINGRLTTDIVVNNDVLDENGNLSEGWESFRVWTPIALDEDGKRFWGTFDGQGHSISGLFLQDTERKHVALFAALEKNCIIKNLGVIDSYFSGDQYVAGICAVNYGTLTHCYNTASCRSNSTDVGGIAGFNNNLITNCYNTGNISGNGNGGGIAGVSWTKSLINNCYNMGAITNQYSGGIVAFTSDTRDFSNCYYLEGSAPYGGGDFWLDITACSSDDLSSGKMAYQLNNGSSDGYQAWYQTLGEGGDTHPVLNVDHGTVYCGFTDGELDIQGPRYSNSPDMHIHIYDAQGFCTQCQAPQPATLADDIHEISTTGQLYWFAAMVNNGYNNINGKLKNNIIVNQNVLTSDGTLNPDHADFRVWTPIGNARQFLGSFDGQGHTVSGLYVNDRDLEYVGLFGYIYNSASVSNLGLIDSYFYGYSHVGGIASYNFGTIDCCYNTSYIEAYTSYAGGIAADNFNIVQYCYNVGSVKARDDSAGAICGNYDNRQTSTANVEKCYYVSESWASLPGIATGTFGDTYGKPIDAFHSGWVTFNLNNGVVDGTQKWYQDLSNDPYPVLNIVRGTVYATDDENVFSNDPDSNLDHIHNYNEDGFCSICNALQPADLVTDAYRIANVGQLYWFAETVKVHNNINACLVDDIVVNRNVMNGDEPKTEIPVGFRFWTPISSYNGIFDGQGHSISGLYYNDTVEGFNNVGLFSTIEQNGKVVNLAILDSYFYATYANMGSICGSNYGEIRNCFNAARIDMANYATSGLIGGISGVCAGGIYRCCNVGLIDGNGITESSYTSNCACLEGRATDPGFPYSAEQFANGEVAWALNGSVSVENPVWRQNIGEDPYPVFDKSHGIVLKASTNGLNAFVRPEDGTLENADRIFEFAGIHGRTVYGEECFDDVLEAEHPYVFTTENPYVCFIPDSPYVTYAVASSDNEPAAEGNEPNLIISRAPAPSETNGLIGVLNPNGQTVIGPNYIVFNSSTLNYAPYEGRTLNHSECYVDPNYGILNTPPNGAEEIGEFGDATVTALDQIGAGDDSDSQKYNILGIPVGDNYRGFVISRGSKTLRK